MFGAASIVDYHLKHDIDDQSRTRAAQILLAEASPSTQSPFGRSPRISAALGHKPHPKLADLPANTALDLGLYDCESRVPGLHCGTPTDYSRFIYDPFNHRLLLFGGGHAATGRTDIDGFDLNTLTWASLYPSMTCEEVREGNIDPKGFHRKTGHPVARHTYDMNVIGDLKGVPHLFLLSTEGAGGKCHPYGAPIRSVAAFPLRGAEPSWVYSKQFRLPWHYAAAAEYDPVSKKIIVIGRGRGASSGGMWVYDPNDSSIIVVRRNNIGYEKYDNNLVYFPPLDKMYLITRSKPNTVFEITLDREDWQNSKGVKIETSGDIPILGITGYAYDSKNEIIGGGVANGKFRLFDPKQRTWKALTMNNASTRKHEIRRGQYHTLDYDPVNNVFLFMTHVSSRNERTWAYRYK